MIHGEEMKMIRKIAKANDLCIPIDHHMRPEYDNFRTAMNTLQGQKEEHDRLRAEYDRVNKQMEDQNSMKAVMDQYNLRQSSRALEDFRTDYEIVLGYDPSIDDIGPITTEVFQRLWKVTDKDGKVTTEWRDVEMYVEDTVQYAAAAPVGAAFPGG